MKKTFTLSHPKIKPARMIDSIKHDIKKYLKRERNKALLADADYWDFDCKFGDTEQDAVAIAIPAFSKAIDAAVERGLTSFYVEILAKPGFKSVAEVDVDDLDEDEA